jgi:hypothetical protein
MSVGIARVIEHEGHFLAGAQRTADHLQVQRKRSRRSQPDHAFDTRDVEALTDDAAVAQDLEVTVSERSNEVPPSLPWRLTIDVLGAIAALPKRLGNELRVSNVDAEGDS